MARKNSRLAGNDWKPTTTIRVAEVVLAAMVVGPAQVLGQEPESRVDAPLRDSAALGKPTTIIRVAEVVLAAMVVGPAQVLGQEAESRVEAPLRGLAS